MEGTPLMTASSRRDLNININKNVESRSSENVDDGAFPSLLSNYDRGRALMTGIIP